MFGNPSLDSLLLSILPWRRTLPGSWEFRGNGLYDLLVGDEYGGSPEKQLDSIHRDRVGIAKRIFTDLELTDSDVGLEIGSGLGHMAAHVAPRVRQLHCADVSRSFLRHAKRNCRGLSHVKFHLVQPAAYPFLSDRSIDFAYSHWVFIHFNLYEIFLHLSELKRVLRPGRGIWFDIYPDNRLNSQDYEKLADLARYYRRNSKTLRTLLQFNSPKAVRLLSERMGFECVLSRSTPPTHTLCLISRP